MKIRGLPREFNDIDLLIQTPEYNLAEKLEKIMMKHEIFLNLRSCPMGISALFSDSYIEMLAKPNGGLFVARFHDTDDKPCVDLLYSLKPPMKVSEVMKRAELIKFMDTGLMVKTATVQDLIEMKRIASVAPERQEEKRANDSADLQLLEALATRAAKSSLA